MGDRTNKNPSLIFRTRVMYYLNKFSIGELKVVLQIGKNLLKEKIDKADKIRQKSIKKVEQDGN